jgi:hemerythrin superfamily protein
MPGSISEMDGITLILTDHRIVEELFLSFERTDDPERKLMLAAKIVEELSVHADVEERELYPVIRERLEDGDELAEHALEEHAEAKEVLRAIEGTPVDDPAFDQRMRELIEEVRHHVEEEETEHLAKLRSVLGVEENRELGRRLRAAKHRAPVSPGVDAEKMTRDELYERAREIDLTGRSEMTKDELADALERQG